MILEVLAITQYFLKKFSFKNKEGTVKKQKKDKAKNCNFHF